MFVLLRLITLAPDRVAECDRIVAGLVAVAPRLPALSTSWVAPVLDAVTINAGHIVWRAELATETAALALVFDPAWRAEVLPLLDGAQVETIGYRVTRSRIAPAQGGIWRALVFRVMPGGFPTAAALEEQLLLMPKYIPAIRSWALSQTAFVDGCKPFTHVWEQEFDAVGGLTGDYMSHPIHWGVVDGWFDAEAPNYIVDPQLVQVVGAIDRAIIGAAPRLASTPGR